MGPRVLFNRQHIYELVEDEKDRLKKAYDALPDDKALDESFTQNFKKQFMLDVPKMRPDDWTSEQNGDDITVYVPFDGDPAVFNISPSASNSMVAQGEIVGHELLFRLRPRTPDFDVKAFVRRELLQVEFCLNSLRGTMEHMGQRLEIGLRESMMARKRSIEHKAKLGANIGIPRRQLTPAPVESKPAAPPKPAQPEKVVQETWDIFMSHASPDKPWVRELVQALRTNGVSVWFDEDSLEWGEDLQRGINRGLINSRKAIAVLSKSYLAQRKWTESEISGLLAREKLGETLILPIWHQVTEADLKQYNLILASRIAKVSDTDRYDDIVHAVLKVLRRTDQVVNFEHTISTRPATHGYGIEEGGLVAYAWYRQNGSDAQPTPIIVRQSDAHLEWFILIDGENELTGTEEEIAPRFLAADHELKTKGFSRTAFCNLFNMKSFELP